MRARIAFAHFDAQRLLPLSWRFTRQPANSLMSAAAASRCASSFGMSAGSFWPSPSRVAIQGAARGLDAVAHRGALAGVAEVADDAQFRRGRLQVAQALQRRVARGVVDVDDFEADHATQRSDDLADQRRDVVFLVVHRHDDRQLRVPTGDARAHAWRALKAWCGGGPARRPVRRNRRNG
jgi:hypothetical protein